MIKIGVSYNNSYIVVIYNKKYTNSNDLIPCIFYAFEKHRFVYKLFKLNSIREQEINIKHDDRINIIKEILENKGIRKILS